MEFFFGYCFGWALSWAWQHSETPDSGEVSSGPGDVVEMMAGAVVTAQSMLSLIHRNPSPVGEAAILQVEPT
jgi:hypothetical protein